jgi:hypothetical protein
MKSNLTHQRLKELVSYDKETGNFFRNVPVANIKAGLVVARPAKNGYVRMHIDGHLYYLHRLAWFYEHNEWPIAIDHIDGNKQNNKIENLRSATYGQNMQNTSAKTKAASGFKGAYFHPKTKNWQSKIMLDGKTKSLGYYKTPEEAHQAYIDGKNKFHTFNPELRT